MTKFYNALNDGMFKAIFCNENNRDLLERLIYESIGIKVKVISAVSKELPKNKIRVKGKTLDVICETNDKKIINIEVNNYIDKYNHRRNFAYGCKIYSDSLDAGEDYIDMPDFYQINLTTSDKDIPDYEIYNLKGKRYNDLYINNFTVYEYNLTKLKHSCYNRYEFLNMLSSDKEELDKKVSDKEMEKLKSEVKRLNSDSKFIEFLSDEKEYMMEINTSRKVGFQEGLTAGIEQNTKDIAKNMLDKKMDIETISTVTGLKVEEIENLK